MIRSIVLVSKQFVLAASALMVMLIGLSCDPQQTLWETARFSDLWLQDARLLIQKVGVSPKTGEYYLAQNIGGFDPAANRDVSLNKVFNKSGVPVSEPEAMLAANMHPLYFRETYAAAEGQAAHEKPMVSSQDHVSVMASTAVDDSYAPIGFYCTHNAESYYPENKQSRVENGKGLINQVGKVMAEETEKKGIGAIFDETVHDSPDYNLSYAKSKATLEKLTKNGDWSAFIDVHRDAIPDKKSPVVVEIDEKMAAQILIIVGSDERKPNPRWADNLNFAERIFKKGQKMYPGLIRGVRIKPGTYNQEIHPPSILVEVGNEYNSLDEACYSAGLFADILINVIKEEN